MRSWPLVVLFTVLSGTVLTSCSSAWTGMECTAAGCSDGLVVRVTPAAPWPQGAYRFVIEADGVTTTCTGTLPLGGCATRAITCDREGVSITESGCALPPSAHGFGDLTLPGTPESIRIQVQRDGETVGDQTFTPAYQTSQPNGPSCPPVCTNASVELALSLE